MQHAPSITAFLIPLTATNLSYMKVRFAIPLLILALPLAALGFTFFSDNLLERATPSASATHVETTVAQPSSAPSAPVAVTSTVFGLTVRPEIKATPWNLFAGTAALGLVLLLRRL